ncbi:unnamed protein product [Lupinus luteus]|uniref:RRM domain-containing protein n=1 Tax=Lupinus luteus TaxID=3873 RepID=A0AAV1VYV5_LUPLU
MQQPPSSNQQFPQQQWMMQQQQQPASSAWAPQPIPQQNDTAASSGGEIKSLWIGDLQHWMDESYITNCFVSGGEVVSVKIIRNKQTGMPEGYGFIEFTNRAAAERNLHSYNGTLMPNSDQNFRLNWAMLGPGERRQDDGADHTVFVGDLAADVTDYVLLETFRAHYPSVKGAKVVIDRSTGRSKGYGFVRFADEGEQLRAMTEMNGMPCSTRPMRIGPAANKKPLDGQQYQTASYQITQGNQGDNDPNNTTIFVGNLDSSVSDDLLRQVFGRFGNLVHVKIPVGKRCGFVQFADRACAEQALSALKGTTLLGPGIRLSWGRSPNKQSPTDQVQWNGAAPAYYGGYAQGYNPYAYAPATQDPNMYYGGYPGYGNYQQPANYQQPQQ